MVHKSLVAWPFAGVLLLSGCASVNPYNDDTMCPARNDFGQCVSMTEAYEHTLDDTERTTPAIKSHDADAKDSGKESDTAKPKATLENGKEKTYRGELYAELSTLLRAPKTPVMKPPTVRRVLVLPYQDGALFMPRYFYMVIDPGQWVLKEVADKHGDAHSVELFSKHEK